ncbi:MULTISPECIES: hypothetical protein [Cryobacterium]|uniref:DUF5667 domain-containing protein n=2 Tax=Bacteria TaxID=2 RepID=A0ABY2IQY9_9MICO|nr:MULTISPECIES: hypothetical protein [Cryobacterium]MDY7528566.1 hypothetical protein [Cryobacterium sp. 10C2]MDY7555698.1 hypothetical protein [Cryobacterium sp. 10C3]MEB0002856.1 hypothetical protein [Cryobacterium sp. RTC2.1]MEB0291118.1 hypothetical protein [Cryobacterium sp. 10C2]TFC20937.1 hypothetical protein E3O46_08445 [Cryobacterium glucosi]
MSIGMRTRTGTGANGIRGRLAALVGGALLVAAALTGCASDSSPVQPSTATQLQSGVLSVTEAAAAGDYPGASAALDAVQADLLTAAATGQVTGTRATEIQAAIDSVTADLAALEEAARLSSAPPSAVPVPAPSVDSGNDKGNGKKDKCNPKKDNCDG